MSVSSRIKHVVVMMFENRSFDSMLGFLYEDTHNKSPLGHPFEGLTGTESNPDANGKAVPVSKIDKNDPYAYRMPKKDPGEGFTNTNFQLFGAASPPYPKGIEKNKGFVRDFADPLTNETDETDKKYLQAGEKFELAENQYKSEHYEEWYKKASPKNEHNYVPPFGPILPSDIMQIYTPETLPVLSGLAKGYAVCDHWYCSAPTETLPNRAFTHMGTSEGYLYDEKKSYRSKSIFKHLNDHGKSWGIFGNNGRPYTIPFCEDLDGIMTSHGSTYKDENTKDENESGSVIQHLSPNPTPVIQNAKWGSFDDFKTILQQGNGLPEYTFLEPVWGSKGNSQHPNYNVAAGEQYLYDIYQALRDSSYWEDTLLIITYDEHGGCYDHITPPEGATSPPAKSKAFGFDFDRFGIRVPTLLISPWIEAGTVYRTSGNVPLDHTSILATIHELFGTTYLTDRDKNAPHVLDVLTLDKVRTDNPIEGVVVPQDNPALKDMDHASQIQHMHAAALTNKYNRETGESKETPSFKTEDEANQYIKDMHDRFYGDYYKRD
ncbi:MAG: phosphoesterase [Flavobacteriaceae bacterium]|nr:phosphoesterase [Flavobacteriaceae bacterium]